MRIGRKEYELKGLSCCCCYGLETAGCRQCPCFGAVSNKVFVVEISSCVECHVTQKCSKHVLC